MFAGFISYKMNIFNHQEKLKNHLKTIIENKKSIGFVPTMGALHNGHISLLRKSLSQNNITIISIFVNPTQFNNQEDLQKYPRTLQDDLEKIEKLNHNIIVYAPSVEDIYGKNIVAEHFDYDGLENKIEGKQRPGHFDGVGTIVKRLLEIINPSRAYFGEKDYQQVLIVKKMIEKHKIPTTILMCPILREKNGLAMSSRNQRLTAEQQEKASLIYKTLCKVKELFQTDNLENIYNYVQETFLSEKILELEYFSIADSQTLAEITKKSKNQKYRAFIAVFLGNVRLIDTIALN